MECHFYPDDKKRSLFFGLLRATDKRLTNQLKYEVNKMFKQVLKGAFDLSKHTKFV